jgi:uncharacterized protein
LRLLIIAEQRMKCFESKSQRMLIGRLERGDDVVDSLLNLSQTHRWKTAEIKALGAVTDLEVTEWDPDKKVYREPVRRAELSEVLMLYGNLSQRDGNPFWHLHINACHHENGRTELIAGHLVKAKVFALEFVAQSFDDLELKRNFDEKTGLALW